MIHICLSPPSSAATWPPFRPSLLPSSRLLLLTKHHHSYLSQRKVRNGKCRAEFSPDAPIGVAIGACILSSLVFPIRPSPEDEEEAETALIDTDDARYAVMAIIAFIPYFNWMSWVFAWMDTQRQRYLVYAIVYLAPYLRSNLSLSPEESWLPIASILLCIFHVQLESSIKNGDIQGFQLFNETGEHISSIARKIDSYVSKKVEKDHLNLPSSNEHSRDELRRWGTPKNHSQDFEELDDNVEEANGERKQ